MKSIILSCCFLFTLSAISQEEFTKDDAKQIVDVFFDGFHKGDTLLMKSVMSPDLVMQTAFSDKEGNHKVNAGSASNLLLAIANRPDTQKWEEKLLGYEVQLDGNLAHVWTPYEFWLDGNFSHCGANAFTLVKTDDGWKINHLIDSRRKEGCRED